MGLGCSTAGEQVLASTRSRTPGQQVLAEVEVLRAENEELKRQLANAGAQKEPLAAEQLGITDHFAKFAGEVDPLVLKILSWWFGPEYDGGTLGPEQYALWFGKSDDSDREFRQLFTDLLEPCAGGRFDGWTRHPLGYVALVILMDQCPRAIFRNTARSIGYDWKAIHVTWQALDRGIDTQLPYHERVWFYIVLTHAEDLRAQLKCVALSQERLTEGESTFHSMWMGAFVKHRDVIKLFGRFPHRNKWLGRHTTIDEEEFLNDPKYRFDAKMNFDVDADGKAVVKVDSHFADAKRPSIAEAVAKRRTTRASTLTSRAATPSSTSRTATPSSSPDGEADRTSKVERRAIGFRPTARPTAAVAFADEQEVTEIRSVNTKSDIPTKTSVKSDVPTKTYSLTPVSLRYVGEEDEDPYAYNDIPTKTGSLQSDSLNIDLQTKIVSLNSHGSLKSDSVVGEDDEDPYDPEIAVSVMMTQADRKTMNERRSRRLPTVTTMEAVAVV